MMRIAEPLNLRTPVLNGALTTRRETVKSISSCAPTAVAG